MQIVFTSGSAATLADRATGYNAFIEQLGGQSLVQVEPVYAGATVAKFPRGNVNGQYVFSVRKSHATYAAAAAYMKQEYGRLNNQGSLVTTISTTTLTMANAICRDVSRVEWNGVYLHLRYVFEITTIA